MATISVLGIGAHGGYVKDPAFLKMVSEGYDLTLYSADSATLDEEIERLPDFFDKVSKSDMLFVTVHGDVSVFRHFSNLMQVVETHNISMMLTGCEEAVVLQYRKYFKGTDEDYNYLRCLEAIGGDENQKASLLWALNFYDKLGESLPDPVIPLAQGVYIPGKGAETFENALGDVGHTEKPVIAIFFVNVFLTKHNLAGIDGLYHSVEKAGGEPLAIFFHSYENPLVGSIGLKNIIDHYLLINGKPIMDVVLNTMGFSLTLLAQPGCGEQVSLDNFFKRLGVPVIQAINLQGSIKRWKDSPFGLTPAEIAYCVSSPEFDGQIDAVPYCGTEKQANGDYRQTPIGERCDALAEMAVRWANLNRKPESDKKVAILLYMYPPRQDLAGGGYGLDSLQSVVEILKRLKSDGYRVDWVPGDRKELADRLLEGVTNDDNWKSDEQLIEHSIDLITKTQYGKWFSEIPESAQNRFRDGWGEPPGDVHVVRGKQLIPGFLDGNIFIGFQPDRGKCSSESYHDPWTAPPHQYLGFYRWLKHEWGVDALVHIGTHGTLEWLPGKSVALSDECDPDIILAKIPNINPYIIDNPGEGMQSKRRQYAVTTTHMIPSMARAGDYDELSELETAVQLYLKTKDSSNNDKLVSMMEKIIALSTKMNIISDLGLSTDCTIEEMDSKADSLYDYLLEIKDAMIKDGLHILGEVPEGERLCEMTYSLIRYPNGSVPSLREAIAGCRGYDFQHLLNNASVQYHDGRLCGEIVDEVDRDVYDLICYSDSVGFDLEKTIEYANSQGLESEEVRTVLDFMCGFLIDAVRKMGDEIGNVLVALDGGYVEPGPSGCPGRGRATILPTGRNFYSIDPDGIPWQTSWDIGLAMAEQMVDRYLRDNGSYPKSVGVVLWATDTMKTGGDDVAYVLRLMGVRPVWSGLGGKVNGLEVIPLSELKRPRIDVTLRISGLFRDTFPNLSNMLDRAVQMVSELDEDDSQNYIAANIRRDILEALEAGLPVDKARRDASIRIFGDAPGQYGCGISNLIDNGNWKTVADLGDSYVQHGCYVYGRGLQGEAKPDLFRKRLGTIDVTVKNHNTRAVDMLDMDDDMDSLGGFNAAVESVRGKKPTSFMGDSSDMQNLKLRTTEEECRFIFRSKINNPKWLEGLKKHGFSGAKELSKLFDYTVGWSATSHIVEKWMFDDLAENFVLDDETREWIKDENPYAMMAMLARLEEAINRGMWDASDEMQERLKDIYLEFEERLEEVTDR